MRVCVRRKEGRREEKKYQTEKIRNFYTRGWDGNGNTSCRDCWQHICKGFYLFIFFFGSVGHCCRGREKNETKTKRDARRSVFFVPISTAAAAAADVSPVRPPPNRARVGHFSGVRIVPRANAYVAQDDPLGFFPFIYYYSSSLFLRTYTCIRVYVYT